MAEETLTPADHDGLVFSLAHALRYGSNGKRTHQFERCVAEAAAEHLVAMLRRSGYVVMKKPARAAHAAPDYNHGP